MSRHIFAPLLSHGIPSKFFFFHGIDALLPPPPLFEFSSSSEYYDSKSRFWLYVVNYLCWKVLLLLIYVDSHPNLLLWFTFMLFCSDIY
jgi:hypothetical protein